MNASDLLQIFRKLRIAVIGDLMLDHYIWGDTRRISPEAPVPVVDVHRDSYTAGGAANVALNLASLGITVDLCGMVGQDEAATRLRAILTERGVSFDAKFSRSDFQTILKTRVLVQHQQLCRLDREMPPAHHRLDLDGAMASCLEKVRAADALIVSDYAKGVITQELIDQIRAQAAKSKIFTALDPKPKRQLEISGFDVITPNRFEALQLAGLPQPVFSEPFPVSEVVRQVFQRHNPRSLIITLGRDGILVCTNADRHMQIPTHAREVFDVSGAGDTIVAVLTASLAAGLSLEDAAHVANAAGGIVVGKIGTAVVLPEELENKLSTLGTRARFSED